MIRFLHEKLRSDKGRKRFVVIKWREGNFWILQNGLLLRLSLICLTTSRGCSRNFENEGFGKKKKRIAKKVSAFFV